MHTFRYLMPLDTMERISRQKLCEDFDNVLERVDKEDIGFVIVDDEGKEGHVLCPARWMEYCFDDDFGCIINSALRYAISRHTYMPGVVVDFIRRSKVVPVDKLSVLITLVLAFVFLHEKFTPKSLIGCILIGIGTLMMVL